MHKLIQPSKISRRSAAVLLGMSFAIFPQISNSQGKVFILNLDGFEKSAFYKSYKAVSKNNYPLKSGGINYRYAFADTDGTDEKIAVELSSAPFFFTVLGVEFNGTSLRNPATLTRSREKFLRDLLASTHPDLPIEKVIEFVKSEQARNYPGGSDKMPKVPVGNANMYVGTVGVGLVFGITRQ